MDLNGIKSDRQRLNDALDFAELTGPWIFKQNVAMANLMSKFILASALMCTGFTAFASQDGEFFLDPHIGLGFNVAQGTYVSLGADAGYALSEQLSAGVGAYYAAGRRPDHDREIGGGPFVMFFQPLTTFLVAHIREDIDYIDQRTPVDLGADRFTHVTDYGVASITSIGLHLILSSHFGISGGYRAVLPLSNSDLGKDRSGTYLGASIGF